MQDGIKVVVLHVRTNEWKQGAQKQLAEAVLAPRQWALTEDACSPPHGEEGKYMAIIIDNRLNCKHKTNAVYKKRWADSTSWGNLDLLPVCHDQFFSLSFFGGAPLEQRC